MVGASSYEEMEGVGGIVVFLLHVGVGALNRKEKGNCKNSDGTSNKNRLLPTGYTAGDLYTCIGSTV